MGLSEYSSLPVETLLHQIMSSTVFSIFILETLDSPIPPALLPTPVIEAPIRLPIPQPIVLAHLTLLLDHSSLSMNPSPPMAYQRHSCKTPSPYVPPSEHSDENYEENYQEEYAPIFNPENTFNGPDDDAHIYTI